jgi:RNA polymerase sigma-70 factor, ECF subfamily
MVAPDPIGSEHPRVSSLPGESSRLTAHDVRMRALCEAHEGALLRFTMRLTFGDRPAAEDLTQETLLRAWRHLDRLAPDINCLRPWLFTVARRLSIDSARAIASRPKRAGVVDMSALPSRDDEMERVVIVQSVRKALATLSAAHAAVIVEVYFRGRSLAETAANLGIPVGTVKSRAHYALLSLRQAIEDAGGG